MSSPEAASGAERWRAVQRAVDLALDAPPGDRAAVLDAACGDDASLREEAARLLAACERAESDAGPLATPASVFAAPMLADLAAHDDAAARARGADELALLQRALAGRYAVERELGRGGMAIVYLAQDLRHARPVAIKVVARDQVAPTGAERFLREIRTAARLTHPHVLGVHDSGEADGLLYYVMPFIRGETLRARLAREGALPLADALRLMRELADALAHAHAHGVVHRDLKPENVLLSEGHAVVADFGIAVALAAAHGDPAGDAGLALGTPGYMAPEQARGQVVDHRADLYALGVVAYEMLAGVRPFDAPPEAAPTPVGERRTDVPPPLAELVHRLLAARPDERPAGADVVLRLLNEPPAASAAARPPSRRSRARAIGGVAVGLVAVAWLLVGGGWRPWRRDAPSATSPSVAVLAFANTGGDPADEAFADGLTDELIAGLGRVPGLRVAGRTSTFALKGTKLGVRAVAETLGVGTVVEGSYRRSGRRLRVAAQLVSAADGRVLWADAYDRELSDVFAVQEELARAIVGALRGRLRADSTTAVMSRLTGDVAAYELYLRGRYILNARNHRDAVHGAVGYFEQALARDSSFVQAHAWLAEAYALLGALAHGPPDAQFARARAAAERALALDPGSAEAHAALAHVRFAYDFDWAASERAYRRALALDPANVRARVVFAIRLQDEGRVREALAQLDSARALDPLAPMIGAVRGRVLVNARRPAEAIRPLQEALALSPDLDLAHQQLGHAYLALGRPADAIAALRRAAALSGLRDSAHLAYAHAVIGERAAAERIVRALLDSTTTRRHVPPFHVAMAYAGLGDADAAFAWLERGFREHGSFMDGVMVTPAFEPLHGDPRWRALLRRMRLAP